MAWDQQVAQYVEENHLDAKLANAAEDKYFGTLASAKPQIYGVYWSKPQVEARQSEQHTRYASFSTGYGKPKATASVTSTRSKRRSMRIACAGGRRSRLPSACRRMWTVVRLNVGLIRTSGKSTATYFLEIGRSTTRTMRHTAPMSRRCLPGCLLHVPHFPGLDGFDAPRKRRWHFAADPDRGRHGLHPAARSAGRCTRR